MTQQQRCNNNTHTVLDDDDVNVDDKATEVQTNYFLSQNFSFVVTITI